MNFKYLGSIISSTGTCERDIENRIAMGKRATKSLHVVTWNNPITQETQKMLFNSVVQNIVLTKDGELVMGKCGRRRRLIGREIDSSKPAFKMKPLY